MSRSRSGLKTVAIFAAVAGVAALVYCLGKSLVVRPIAGGASGAISDLTEQGAAVRYADKAPKSLSIIGPDFDDEVMSGVATLTSLESVRLSSSRISDAGMAPLKELRQLKRLDLER